MPRVELISNVFHYYYTALALHRQGFLGRYITGPSTLSDEAWVGRLGGPFQRLWVERRLESIPPRRVKRLWLHEIVQKAVHRLGGGSDLANWACAELFANRAARLVRDCDVVHFVQSVGWVVARKMKRRGARIICDMREEHPLFQEKILAEEADHLGIGFTSPGSRNKDHVLEEIALSDYIFCPSTYAKRTFLEHGVQENKLVICPYGVDLATFNASERPRPGKIFTVLFLGQVCMRKGVHYLLEGFRRASLPDARLTLVGPVDPSFRSILDKYRGLFEEVGSVPHSRISRYYFDADVFVMPSLADSYGLVVLEAMASGLPVIVSENTGMADLIRKGSEGFVVPIRNSDAIAEKLAFLHENREQRVSMGRAAMTAVQGLDWNHYQRGCTDFYKSLFREPAIPPLPQTSGAAPAIRPRVP
jgi:glycosyltransferase involved in cell wall biosynthesis